VDLTLSSKVDTLDWGLFGHLGYGVGSEGVRSGRWRIGRWRLAAIAVVFAVLGPSTPSTEHRGLSSVPGPAVSAQALVVEGKQAVGRRLPGVSRADRSRAAPSSVTPETPETSTSVASAPSRAREYSAEATDADGRWTRAEVKRVIRQAAARWGLSAQKMLRVAECESGLNPRAVGGGGLFLGLYQQHRSYWPQRARSAGYAGVSAFDPVANANVSAWLVVHGGGWAHWGCA